MVGRVGQWLDMVRSHVVCSATAGTESSERDMWGEESAQPRSRMEASRDYGGTGGTSARVGRAQRIGAAKQAGLQ